MSKDMWVSNMNNTNQSELLSTNYDCVSVFRSTVCQSLDIFNVVQESNNSPSCVWPVNLAWVTSIIIVGSGCPGPDQNAPLCKYFSLGYRVSLSQVFSLSAGKCGYF